VSGRAHTWGLNSRVMAGMRRPGPQRPGRNSRGGGHAAAGGGRGAASGAHGRRPGIGVLVRQAGGGRTGREQRR
jgi:hypothetical protein